MDLRIGCREFTLILFLSTLFYIAHISPKLLIHERPLDPFNRSRELLLNLKLELPPNRTFQKLPSMSLPRCTGNISSCFEHSKKYTPAGVAETCCRLVLWGSRMPGRLIHVIVWQLTPELQKYMRAHCWCAYINSLRFQGASSCSSMAWHLEYVGNDRQSLKPSFRICFLLFVKVETSNILDWTWQLQEEINITNETTFELLKLWEEMIL